MAYKTAPTFIRKSGRMYGFLLAAKSGKSNINELSNRTYKDYASPAQKHGIIKVAKTTGRITLTTAGKSLLKTAR